MITNDLQSKLERCDGLQQELWSYRPLSPETLKPLKEKISITIDSDILEKLRDRAEYDDRSLSQYINLVLKKHLEEEQNRK